MEILLKSFDLLTNLLIYRLKFRENIFLHIDRSEIPLQFPEFFPPLHFPLKTEDKFEISQSRGNVSLILLKYLLNNFIPSFAV
jgi:hypothetical protein